MKQEKIQNSCACTLQELIAYFAIVFLGVIFVAANIKANPDNDAWWLMATGRYIWENGEFPVNNPFVMHEGFEMVAQQWVTAVGNYLLYDAFGKWGLVCTSLAAFFTNMALLCKLSSFYTDSKAAKTVCVVVGMLLFGTYLNTRPTQFTISVLLLGQLAIEMWKKKGDSTYLWWLPVLSVVEINIHASFWVFLFVFALPHIAPNILDKGCSIAQQIKEKKDFVLPLAASMLAGFANPYGIDGVFYLAKSYGSSNLCSRITELKSPEIASYPGVFSIFAMCVLAVYLYRGLLNKKRSDISKICMLAGVSILAAAHTRNVWMLAFGLCPVLCELLGSVPWNAKVLTKKERLCYGAMFAAVLAAEVALLSDCSYEPVIPVPQKVADYLENSKKKDDVVLYTTFNTGGYMEWAGYKVYMDARPELFQKKLNSVADIADEYLEVETGCADYDAFVSKYSFTHILTDKGGYFDLYLKTAGTAYRKALEDGPYVLYESKPGEEKQE